MANEIKYMGTLAQTGLSLVARLYDETGAAAPSDVTLTEVGSTAVYRGDMPAYGAATFAVRILSSDAATLYGTGVIHWDGNSEVTQTTLDAAIKVTNQGVQDASILQPHTTDIA